MGACAEAFTIWKIHRQGLIHVCASELRRIFTLFQSLLFVRRCCCGGLPRPPRFTPLRLSPSELTYPRAQPSLLLKLSSVNPPTHQQRANSSPSFSLSSIQNSLSARGLEYSIELWCLRREKPRYARFDTEACCGRYALAISPQLSYKRRSISPKKGP